MTREQFINEIAKYVQKYAPQYGIKVCSPIVAQAVLESGAGTSELAVKANNFFGLKYKAGRCPSASGIYVKVGSEQNADGSYVSSSMQWCKFDSIELCVKGYFEFISHSRYSNLKGVTDPKKYLELIKADGYATSLKYVDNVYRIIQTDNLTRFDIIEKSKMFKVYIDAGHYGEKYNKSTTGLNYYESAMTWKLSQYLKAELEKRNVIVSMSRTNINENPSLYNRGYGAGGYDLFLSLHSNACATPSVDYPIVYRGYDKTEANDFAQKLATMIHQLMGTSQAGKVGTRQGSSGEYYGVLRGARAAGLTYYYIIEHSFHTNKKATEWLMSDYNLKLLAKNEAQFIVDYFINKKTSAPIVNTNNNVSSAPSVSTNTSALYRVRKSWDNPSSQLGAYSSLERAKSVCKTGYYVFDDNGNVVYPVVNNTSSIYIHKDFVKEVQAAIGAKVDGIAGKETLSKTITVSKTKNNRHAVVKPIQKYLNSQGYDAGAVDGIAGIKFDVALKAFQKANGCVVDGEATAQKTTWKKLLKL